MVREEPNNQASKLEGVGKVEQAGPCVVHHCWAPHTGPTLSRCLISIAGTIPLSQVGAAVELKVRAAPYIPAVACGRAFVPLGSMLP